MISEWVKKIIMLGGKIGYLGVFIASLGIIPAEIIVPLAGASMPESILTISFVSALGETTGAILTYLTGLLLGKKNLSKLLKLLKISEDSYKENQNKIKNYGSFFIIFSRLAPGARIASSLAAGFLRLSFPTFIIAVLIGSFIFTFIFSFLGSRIGINLEKGNTAISFCLIAVILVILILLYFLISKNHRK